MRSLVVLAAANTAGHVQGLLSRGTRLAERAPQPRLAAQADAAVNDLWPDPTEPAG
jgi:hypothetical protein